MPAGVEKDIHASSIEKHTDRSESLMSQDDIDQQLWKAFRAGEAYALGALSKKYYRSLFHYATRFTKDTALVEDCIQDVFLNLWNRRTHLGETASIKFYLLKALRNHLLKAQQKKSPLEELQGWNDPVSDDEHAESRLIHQESSDKLQHLMATLPKRQREALYLRYYEELTYEEIGQLMGIHAQSVANLLQQSLKKMRERWIAYLSILLLTFPFLNTLSPFEKFFSNR